MAAVTVLARSAKVAVRDAFDGAIKVKRFKYKIATVLLGGAALETLSIVRLAKLPAGARIFDIQLQWEAGGGTNTMAVRRCAVSDGTTHTDLKTGITGGSAGWWSLHTEADAAETCPIPLAVESWIDIEMAGTNGWPVDKYIQGSILYSTPTFDDELADVAGTAAADLGV